MEQDALLTVFTVFQLTRLDLLQIYGFTKEQVEQLDEEDMQNIATAICFDMQYTKRFVAQKVCRETTKVLSKKGTSNVKGSIGQSQKD